MMFDYLMAWANDNDLKKEGVVAFIGADDKAFCSDQSIILSSAEKKRDCNRGNDGVRGKEKGEGEKTDEKKKEESESKFQDDEEDKCFSWEGKLIWTGRCTEWDKWKNKVDVGQMYGLSKDNAKGFKKLKGFTTYI